MTKKIIFLLLLLSNIVFSQETYTKEISIKSDNDLYSSKKRDRYYTSGMFLSYKYLSKKKTKKALKKIYEIQVGQQLYTPQVSTVVVLTEHDRPFAGYLYGSFGFSNFYKNKSILKVSSQIGTIGTNAFGEEIMSAIHKAYGFNLPIGWKYQIANTFTLNLNADYIKNISGVTLPNTSIDWVSSLNIGSIFNNLSTALNFKIGLIPLKEINKTISYNGNIGAKKHNNKEFFINLKPKITYAAYDATVQGSFLNKSSPVTYKIKPIVFSSEIGLFYAIKRIQIGYTFNIHSKKLRSENVPNTNNYGSIDIKYLFN